MKLLTHVARAQQMEKLQLIRHVLSNGSAAQLASATPDAQPFGQPGVYVHNT